MASTLLALLPTVSFSACGSGGDGTGPSAVFDFAVGSPTLTLSIGSAAVNAVSVTRADGFEGAVAVTVEGLPAGVVAASVPIAPTATSAAFTLTATGSATTGTTTITVRAVAPGATARTTTVQVTVKLAPAFSLALASQVVAIESRYSGTSSVSIARQGDYEGAVNLVGSGAPQGMSLSFAPSVPGTYPLVIHTRQVNSPNAFGSAPLVLTIPGGHEDH